MNIATMKEIIIVYGNMGSGKSTFAKALNKQLPGYQYVCLDDQRREHFGEVLAEGHSSVAFERKVKKETEGLLSRHPRIIYETTGGTEFFKSMYYNFLKEGHELLVVKVDCPLDECLKRHERRERKGHFHIVPKYKKAMSPYEAIRKFDEKAAWIKPHLILDSSRQSTDEMINQFMMKYSKSDRESELRRIMSDFRYDEALTWFKRHVEGKFFVKELLSKGEDDYNRGKLKTELNRALEAMQEPDIPDPEPMPEERTPPKKNNLPKVVENAAISPEEHQLEEEWRPKFTYANHLFSQLDHIQDDGERKARCFEILDLMDEVEEIWQKRDFLKKYGKLPNFDKASMDQLTTNQAATRIRTLRTYISKAKKGILKDDRVPVWDAEIKELERIIR